MRRFTPKLKKFLIFEFLAQAIKDNLQTCSRHFGQKQQGTLEALNAKDADWMMDYEQRKNQKKNYQKVHCRNNG